MRTKCTDVYKFAQTLKTHLEAKAAEILHQASLRCLTTFRWCVCTFTASPGQQQQISSPSFLPQAEWSPICTSCVWHQLLASCLCCTSEVWNLFAGEESRLLQRNICCSLHISSQHVFTHWVTSRAGSVQDGLVSVMRLLVEVSESHPERVAQVYNSCFIVPSSPSWPRKSLINWRIQKIQYFLKL